MKLPIEYLPLFRNARIAVVGDLMLDVYLRGRATRLSPEAPIPVVEVKRRDCCLGGAANVMRNIVTLGGKVFAFGVIGNDDIGDELLAELKKYGIATEMILRDPSRRTTRKQRVLAGNQQLIRLDYEDADPIDGDLTAKLVTELIRIIRSGEVDAVIFEDYAKGVVTESLLEPVIAAARERGVITALDPMPGNIKPVKNLTVMKPNRCEAFAMASCLDRGNHNGEDVTGDAGLREVASTLLKWWAPEQLIISLAAQGMALFRRDCDMVAIPTWAQEVFDVSGAGDTVIAAYTLALISGAPPEVAAEIANHAAGIVVGKVGTVTVAVDELKQSFSRKD